MEFVKANKEYQKKNLESRKEHCPAPDDDGSQKFYCAMAPEYMKGIGSEFHCNIQSDSVHKVNSARFPCLNICITDNMGQHIPIFSAIMEGESEEDFTRAFGHFREHYNLQSKQFLCKNFP